MTDTRPSEYKYYNQLMEHLNWDKSKIFPNSLIYPKQIEIHLPADHKKACNLNCPHCQGKYFNKEVNSHWEIEVLELLNNLKGKIPYHIYGGAYSEPLMNPYYMTFLATTKKYGNHFGIHTNGVLLNWLENNQGWLTELNRISTDKKDYLSISLDAGNSKTWGKIKGTKNYKNFDNIISSIEIACKLKNKNSHAIRICYLLTENNCSESNIKSIIKIAKNLKVDSLRFSIPYDNYNINFNEVKEYKKNIEIPLDIKFKKLLKSYLSESKLDIPYIFYMGPEYADVDKMNFKKCVYHAFQITIGADGYIYKCSSSATPTAKHCRLGKFSIDNFEKCIILNNNYNWNPNEMCFKNGIRCNRMALEINTIYNKENCNE